MGKEPPQPAALHESSPMADAGAAERSNSDPFRSIFAGLLSIFYQFKSIFD